jgi:hypothetical protein
MLYASWAPSPLSVFVEIRIMEKIEHMGEQRRLSGPIRVWATQEQHDSIEPTSHDVAPDMYKL